MHSVPCWMCHLSDPGSGADQSASESELSGNLSAIIMVKIFVNVMGYHMAVS